jgi:hypothetical protein
MAHMSNAIRYAVAGLSLASAFAAIVAAFFWYRSATYQATREQGRRDGPEIMVGGETPLIATLDGQGRFSKYAAGMAACAAILQAAALILQAIGGT